MAQDTDLDALILAEAPETWSEAMAQAAAEAGLALETADGASISAAIAGLCERIHAWAEDGELARELAELMTAGKVMLDPPLIRAALSPGAELTTSAALIRWPQEPRE
jgi:hypothetical protein